MPLPAILAPAAIKTFLGKAWPFILALVIVVILAVVFKTGAKMAKSEADLQRERGNVEALEGKNKADANAATQRRADDLRLNDEGAQLKEAQRNAQSPTDRRLARHRCIRLQQQARKAGQPTPAC